jgi:hypothetical protein
MRILLTVLFSLLCACRSMGAPGQIADGETMEVGGLVLKAEPEGYQDAMTGLASTPQRELGLQSDGADGDDGGDASDPAAQAGAQEPDPRPSEPERLKRQVIYSATLQVVVVSVADARERVQRFAEELGGWLQESDGQSVTVRVPADKFESTLTRIATLGEVVDRVVRASDVTEEMFDIELRLVNARKTRERLLEHLAASTKIEDTLKIETELARVSEEIERLEGRQRLLKSQIAMSRIRVNFSSHGRNEHGAGGSVAPFPWVDELGGGLVAGAVESLPKKAGFFSRGPRFEPPKGFIRYFSRTDLVEALDADGLRLKVQRQSNFDEADAQFWIKLARKSLVERRDLAVTSEVDLGDGRRLIRGTREVGGVPCGYLLVLVRGADYVHSFEAWGPETVFAPAFEALVTSARGLTR